ncbi:MAG: hypothetical protein BGN86_05210 [Caulobacterales bacterium 68-7]|nr:MAG: hypothetical protein BGN86_05210 [Caulobacterales bacterium 68-7]
MSNDKLEHDTGHLHRLVLFSDAVFAIAITLLAIELHPPEGWDHTIGGFFHLMGHKLVAFAISFAVIAVNWWAHRRTFERLVKADGWLDACNFLMLAAVTLTPFATEVLYEDFSRAAIAIYIFTVAAIGWAHGLVWGYAAFIGNLVDPNMTKKSRLFVLFSAGITPGMMCLLSFLSVAGSNIWGFVGMGLWLLAMILISRRLKPDARRVEAEPA